MTLTSGQIYCAFSEQIVVRRATADDIDPVCRLVEVSPMAAQWSPGQVAEYCAGYSGDDPHIKGIFVAVETESVVPEPDPSCISHTLGQIVGFIAASIVANVRPAECSLENLAVAGPYRRRGIGARLLTVGALWCRTYGGTSMWLEVRESNHVAIRFYEHAGFVIAGHRVAYYTQPDDDAVEMQCVFRMSGVTA